MAGKLRRQKPETGVHFSFTIKSREIWTEFWTRLTIFIFTIQDSNPGNVYIIGQMGIPKSINLIKKSILEVCLEARLTGGSGSDEDGS